VMRVVLAPDFPSDSSRACYPTATREKPSACRELREVGEPALAHLPRRAARYKLPARLLRTVFCAGLSQPECASDVTALCRARPAPPSRRDPTVP